jgi:hypothetical protein
MSSEKSSSFRPRRTFNIPSSHEAIQTQLPSCWSRMKTMDFVADDSTSVNSLKIIQWETNRRIETLIVASWFIQGVRKLPIFAISQTNCSILNKSQLALSICCPLLSINCCYLLRHARKTEISSASGILFRIESTSRLSSSNVLATQFLNFSLSIAKR